MRGAPSNDLSSPPFKPRPNASHSSSRQISHPFDGKVYIIINYNNCLIRMALKAKIRRIGTSLGIIIPKETLETMNMREGDTIIIPRIETPVREIRGILKGTGILFEREHADRDENIDQAFTHKNKKP